LRLPPHACRNREKNNHKPLLNGPVFISQQLH
jgi:hypothetical protein